MRIVFYKVFLFVFGTELMQVEVFLEPSSEEIRRFTRSRDNKISTFCKNIQFFQFFNCFLIF